MKAIEVRSTGGPEVLQLVDLPAPQPKPQEVAVKVTRAGINFIDVYQREGRYKVPLPFILGQEGAGVVEATGTAVKTVKIGDRVAWTGVLGSYAERAVIPAERAVPVPDGITDEQAAAAMLQGMTAHYLTHDTYPLQKDQTALVHAAAGGVGLLLVQMARNLGARVIGTVSTEQKARLARDTGADEIILYTKQDFEVEVKRITGNQGVHVVYDGVGKDTFAKGLNVLRRRGMMVLFGGASGAVPPFDPLLLTQKGSLFLTRPSLPDYIASSDELRLRSKALFAMIAANRLKLRVERTYALADVQQAHRELEARKTTGKLLLVP